LSKQQQQQLFVVSSNFLGNSEDDVYLSQQELFSDQSNSNNINNNKNPSSVNQSSKNVKTYAPTTTNRSNPMLNIPTVDFGHSRNPSASNLTAVQPQAASHTSARSRTVDDRTYPNQPQRQPINIIDPNYGPKIHKSVANNSNFSLTSKPHKTTKAMGYNDTKIHGM
jgi:hypothetical protein